MGRLLSLLLVLAASSTLAFAQNQPAELKLQEPSAKVKKAVQSTSNTLMHKFTCRRCGSENHFEWGMSTEKKESDLIPHCIHCGKKYWPKFKPSGFLDRIYCNKQGVTPLPG